MLTGNTMACQIANREEQAEGYVAGLLPGNESEGFELHFFSCSACLSAVRNAEALADALAEPRIQPARPPVTWMRFAVAAAAAVVASLVTFRSPSRLDPVPPEVARPAPTPANPYAALASFDLPKPPSVTLRSATLADLERGLDLYRQRDFGGAVAALRAAARTAPDAVAPFFLGISLLRLGESDQAIAALNGAAARGDSPYLEEAHLYLARAHFANGNFLAAERELELTIALKGDHGEQARAVLEDSRSRRRSPTR